MRLKPGQSASITRTIQDEEVRQFAQLSGDQNPVHIDDAYAQETRFGKRIAHGMLCASLVSCVLGTKLPGPGAIYLSQTLRFMKPVYIGDTVSTRVEVLHVRKDKPIVTMTTLVLNADDEVVLSGEATLLVEGLER